MPQIKLLKAPVEYFGSPLAICKCTAVTAREHSKNVVGWGIGQGAFNKTKTFKNKNKKIKSSFEILKLASCPSVVPTCLRPSLNYFFQPVGCAF